MKSIPTSPQNPRKNQNPVRRIALLGALAAAFMPLQSRSQSPAQDALRRPIAESGLLEQIERIDASGVTKNTAATAPVPRAVAVNPANAVPTPDATAGSTEILKKSKGPTEITAEKATFDNRRHLAIFTGNVVVNDPEFYLTCDKLTAYLKSGPPPDGAAKTAAPKAATEAKPGTQKKGGLDRAVAEGNVNIVQEKLEADGKTSRSTAKAKTADYNAQTGDIILKGRPIVHQGMNQCEATSDATIMTLNRDRNMSVDGPNKTIISEKADLEKKP